MTAVGAVVVNRVRSGGFANSIYGVIYQRGQFGPASSGRLEARLASGVSASARQAARAALNGSDPTGGRVIAVLIGDVAEHGLETGLAHAPRDGLELPAIDREAESCWECCFGKV